MQICSFGYSSVANSWSSVCDGTLTSQTALRAIGHSHVAGNYQELCGNFCDRFHVTANGVGIKVGFCPEVQIPGR
jgi:hypothetical protein